MFLGCVFFFFCKQKTAYEMRISDWSSDVCSSDLPEGEGAVADASLRFIFGEEFLDRRAAVGALIIALRAQPVAPVDTLAVERDAQAEPDRIGVAAAVRCADLPRALPVLPEFRGRELGARGEIGRASCRERVGPYV